MGMKRMHWLLLIVIWTLNYSISARAQCSGRAAQLTATEDTQHFYSPNYPNSYGNNVYCEWEITASNETDAIRVDITNMDVEYHSDCVYDSGEVFDGENTTVDNSLGRFCGTTDQHFVSTGNISVVVFKSDYSMSSDGFKASYRSGPRDSLLEPEESGESLVIVPYLAAAVGGFTFVAIILAISCTIVQVNQAKRQRQVRSIRVQPNNNAWECPAPPAYGEIYASPLSPPPAYSESDPNSSPGPRLPVRPEFMADAPRQNNVMITVAVVNSSDATNPNVRNTLARTPNTPRRPQRVDTVATVSARLTRMLPRTPLNARATPSTPARGTAINQRRNIEESRGSSGRILNNHSTNGHNNTVIDTNQSVQINTTSSREVTNANATNISDTGVSSQVNSASSSHVNNGSDEMNITGEHVETGFGRNRSNSDVSEMSLPVSESRDSISAT